MMKLNKRASQKADEFAVFFNSEDEYANVVANEIEYGNFNDFKVNRDLEESIRSEISTYQDKESKISLLIGGVALFIIFIVLFTPVLLSSGEIGKTIYGTSALLIFFIFITSFIVISHYYSISGVLSNKVDIYDKMFSEEDEAYNLFFVNNMIDEDNKVKDYFSNIESIKKIHAIGLKKYFERK